MNLAVNCLRGEIKQGNTYYEDPHNSFGAFDYVLANPPFNVDDVSLSCVEKDKRFNTYGIPRNKSKVKNADKGKETVPNGNYLWINLFATSLKPQGRAALVMANSASDARHSEADIRKKLIEQKLIYAMLTLPSNMFYTVSLPATLWFFDKAKSDDRILFIDARNIFTQIDRTHRVFSEEQIQNIAIISHLHKGHREKFVQLVDRYFATGIEQLIENNEKIESVYAQFLDTPNDADGKQAVNQLLQHWSELNKLKVRYQHYLRQNSLIIPKVNKESSINTKNQAQHQLYNAFDPFFTTLHEDLKRLDKTLCQHEKQQSEQVLREGTRTSTDRRTKALKSALEELHQDVNNAEIYFQHIHWLQERFPNAAYEDVIGLCKLAALKEIKEQDYSLNPGRYVGVVIEEDGKSEGEFVAELLALNNEFAQLNENARGLESIITHNLRQMTENNL